MTKTDLQNADATADALNLERQARQEDLEKVAQLEVKLGSEVANLTKKLSDLRNNIDAIQDLDSAKAKADAEIKVILPFLFSL